MSAALNSVLAHVVPEMYVCIGMSTIPVSILSQAPVWRREWLLQVSLRNVPRTEGLHKSVACTTNCHALNTVAVFKHSLIPDSFLAFCCILYNFTACNQKLGRSLGMRLWMAYNKCAVYIMCHERAIEQSCIKGTASWVYIALPQRASAVFHWARGLKINFKADLK